MKNLTLLLLCLLLCDLRAAELTDAETLISEYQMAPDRFSSKPEMNGIKYLDFKDFFSWDLITVRFRTDISEQRFVYANKSALETLKQNGKEFPDGSVFVKAGYLSDEDPAFISSMTPAGLRRVQIMVRDKKKYASTDGWGYAIFKIDGTTFAGDPAAKSMACAACHKIVAERGYVFSQLIDKRPVALADITPSKKKLKMPLSAATAGKVITFIEHTVNSIPSTSLIRSLIPLRATSVRLAQGLSQYNFTGAYNEIVPSLIYEAARTQKPAAMMSENNNQFSLAFMMKSSELKCPPKKRPFFVAMAVPPFYLPKSANAYNLEVRKICIKGGP